jgi:hypothetical protein
MNQFGLQYIYTRKCLNETPCIAILNKQKNFFFSKLGNRKLKQVLSGGYQQQEQEGGRYKERV